MSKNPIHTSDAPAAIGPYSQAVRHGDLVFLSGQIPLDPETMQIVEGGIEAQADRMFRNLRAVCRAAGSDLSGIVKLNLYLADMSDFPAVNEVMKRYFEKPYPARAAVGVAALPMGAGVEAEAVLGL